MRAIFSIFFIIIFMNLQGLSHAYMTTCSHHKKIEHSNCADHKLGHECCEKMNSSENGQENHDCQAGHCFKTSDIEISITPVENRLTKKDLSDPLAILNHKYLLARLSKDLYITNNKESWHYQPKEPLYILYLKLLLP